MLTTPTTIPALVKYAENAQKTAAYESGLKKIQEIGFWDYQNPSRPPNTEGLSEYEIAELCLSAGRLYGFFGIIYENGQEISKNLLTNARDLFIKLGNYKEQELSCSNYLALAYWRMGDLRGARDWLKNSFHCIDTTGFDLHNTTRLFTFIVEALIYLSDNKSIKVLKRFKEESVNFENCGDIYLNTLFICNRGIAKRQQEDLDGAVADQIRARDMFEQIGNLQYQSYAENNLAYYFRAKGRESEALKYAKQSLANAKSVLDLRQEGCAEHTLSELCSDARNYEQALTHVEQSIATLKKTECYRYLFVSRKTQIEILWKLGRIEEAQEVFADTLINLTRPHLTEVDGEALKTFIGNLARRSVVIKNLKEDLIEIDEPLAFEIEITTDCHAHLGLKRGSIATARKMKITNGDFVALRVIETGKYYLGVLDSFADIVSLEVKEGEPNLFDKNEVEILGKIIL